MSTILLKESFNSFDIQCDKRTFVSTGRPKLAELVRRRVAELNDLSTNEVARRSGNRISNGTVWNIMNNRVKDVKEDTLKALADALELSEEVVLAAYYDRQLDDSEAFDSEIYVLFKGFNELADKDKAEMLGTIRMLAAEVQRRRPRTSKKPQDKGKGKK